MEFNLNGIQFNKEDLEVKKLSDLTINSIQPSHLFFIPGNSKNIFMLLRAGEYIDKDFIENYKAKGLESVYSLNVSSPEFDKSYQEVFRELHNCKNEIERQLCAQKIMKMVINDFWFEEKESYLTFARICFENFYFLGDDVVQKTHTMSNTLFSRALIASSISVLTCFMHKVSDPFFIKDLYNAVFAMDFGLISKEPLSYTVAQACEKERELIGSGLKYLKNQNRSQKEIDIFINHPIESARFLRTKKEKFFNPEIIETVLFHHEIKDGSGFPRGIPYAAITDLETFLNFSDQMVPFKEHTFEKGDGLELIRKAIRDLKTRSAYLPVENIISHYEVAIEWVKSSLVSTGPIRTGKREAA